MQDSDQAKSNGGVPATTQADVPKGHKLISPFIHFQQLNPSGGFLNVPLLKLDHQTGAYLRERGNDKVMLAEDERLKCNPNLMIDVWSRYVDGEQTEHKVYRTADGQFAPEREELGDTDEHDWPRDKKGKSKDPWSRAVYLPMKGSDGEVVAFKATGKGAIAEIGQLVGMYGSADRGGKVPVVIPESRSFESQHGSTIYVPVFRLADWAFWEEGVPATAVKPVLVPIAPPAKASAAKTIAPPKSGKRGDMDDEIPF